MRANDSGLALEVVDEARQIAHRLGMTTESNQRHVMESTRLAALSWLDQRASQQNRPSDSLSFHRPTYFAEQMGLELNPIIDDARQILGHLNEGNLGEKPCELGNPAFSTLMLEAHSLGSFRPIDRTLALKRRRILGSYFTPIHVAQHIVGITLGPWLDGMRLRGDSSRWVTASEEFTLIDPACGPGVFLISVVDFLSEQIRRFCGRADHTEILSAFVNGLYGVDIDGASVEVATRAIKCRLAELGTGNGIPSSHLVEGDSLIGRLKSDAREPEDFLSEPHRPLNWKEQFESEITGQGGFRFVVMNPPYDRLRPSRAEYIRERLRLGERTVDLQGFDLYKSELKERVDYFRHSGEYHLANKYTLDLHRLFIERALHISQRDARLGFIVPASILGDLSAAALRKELLTTHSISHLEEYCEGSSLFPGVTQAFCIMCVQKGGALGQIPVSSGLEAIIDREELKMEKIPVERIATLSGNDYIVPRVASKHWPILGIIHEHPRLGTQEWLHVYRGELDLTLDKDLVLSETGSSPLLRGSHIKRFSRSKDMEFEESVDYDTFRERHEKSERIGHSDTRRLACQQVSNRRQRWRLKFSLVEPGVVIANSCNYVTVKESSDTSILFYLLGVLNSSLMNWRFSVTNTNNHVSNRELGNLPIPNPFQRRGTWDKVFNEIISEVRAVVDGNMARTRAIDSCIFRLYSLIPEQARLVLSYLSAEKGEIQDITQRMESIQ